MGMHEIRRMNSQDLHQLPQGAVENAKRNIAFAQLSYPRVTSMVLQKNDLYTNAACGAALAEDAARPQAAEYLGPSGTAVSGDGRVLFACLSDAGQLAIVDLPDGSVTRKVRTPAEPTGLALSRDGRRVYVTCAAAVSSVLENYT